MAKSSGTKGKKRPDDEGSWRARFESLQREHQTLREKLSELEAREKELRAANDELGRERVVLRNRAGGIEQRYSELVERTAAAAREADSKTKSSTMTCPKCGGGFDELQHGGVKVDR